MVQQDRRRRRRRHLRHHSLHWLVPRPHLERGNAITRARTLDAGLKRVITVPATPSTPPMTAGSSTSPVTPPPAAAATQSSASPPAPSNSAATSDVPNGPRTKVETKIRWRQRNRHYLHLPKTLGLLPHQIHEFKTRRPRKPTRCPSRKHLRRARPHRGDFTLSASLIDMINDFHSLPV